MSFVTQCLVNSLQAKKIPWVTRISGVQGTEVPSSKFVANLLLHSTVGNKTPLQVTPAVVEKVTMDLPSQKVDIKDTTLLQGLKLADPEFNWPHTIDMLLGMDASSFPMPWTSVLILKLNTHYLGGLYLEHLSTSCSSSLTSCICYCATWRSYSTSILGD